MLADGVRAKRAGWTCYLWYSAEVETILDAEVDAAIQRTKGIFILSTRPPMPKDTRPLRKQQRLQLAGAGYTIHPIEKLQPTKYVVRFAQMAGRSAVNRNWDDVKYFSDLARLRYLYYLGGIHMDVDISLGDMDLDQRYYHNDPSGNVPLMGSLLRTQDDPMVLHLRYLARLRGLSALTKEEWDGYMLALRALDVARAHAAVREVEDR